jgi:phosphate transport system substrate-binding protein
MKFATTALAVALAGFTFAVAPGAHAEDITGAGSTFGGPIYAKWGGAAEQSTGIKLNYQNIGSGAGINQIKNRTVDFGGTDAPLAGKDLDEGKLFQFPTVIGGVDIIVNLPGIAVNQLKLTGPILADIYLGKIHKWNDPQIAAINVGVKLPDLAVAPVHRADGSGTTFVFTNYLSLVSPSWESAVGFATSVKWAVGNGAKGSDGVSATVKQVRGAIGYVESAYATKNKLTTTQMKNQAGNFVSPDVEAFIAAAASADWTKADHFALNLNNQPGAKSWPIESATYVLVPMDAKDPAKTKAVLTLFGWAFDHGDALATEMLYVPLPKSVHDNIKAAWSKNFGG